MVLLFLFLVGSMLFTELAVLLKFYALSNVLLILRRRIIMVLTDGAFKNHLLLHMITL